MVLSALLTVSARVASGGLTVDSILVIISVARTFGRSHGKAQSFLQ